MTTWYCPKSVVSIRALLFAWATATLGCDAASPPEDDPASMDRGPLGKADAAGSCASSSGDYCGGPSAGACWCDDQCVDFGDCCADVTDVCGCAPIACAPDACGELPDGCGGLIQCDQGCGERCEPETVRITTDQRDELLAVAVSGDTLALFGQNQGATSCIYSNCPYYGFSRRLLNRHNLTEFAQFRDEMGSKSTVSAVRALALDSGFAVLHPQNNGSCRFDRYDRLGVDLSNPGPKTITLGTDCSTSSLAGTDAGLALASWWPSGGEPRTVVMRTDGLAHVVPGASSTRVSAGGGFTAVAFDEERDRYLVVYPVAANGRKALHAAFLSTTGFLLSSDVRITTPSLNLNGPAVLERTTNGYALVWRTNHPDHPGGGVWYTTLNDDGALSAEPQQIANANNFAVALSGGSMAIAYDTFDQERRGDVMVDYVDLAGFEARDHVDLAVGPSNARKPQVAWAGDAFVVAYMDDVAGAGLSDIYIHRECRD